jgi:protein arginine N-methyltransferase 1
LDKIFHHRSMLADQVRMAAYQKAIHEAVKAGDVVADIGTGSGILAFFALQAGAKKVYAIEQNKIIEDAEQLAKINGLDKKIVFIRERSDRVELPEKVDVVTSELIGYFGLEENLLRFKIDTRERFLKPGGMLIPGWMKLYLVPVEAEKIWKEKIGLWNSDYYSIDFSPIRHHAVSQRYVTNCTSDVEPLALPSVVSHIDFYKIKKIPSIFRGKITVNKKGAFHGLACYFESGLSPGVVLSTSLKNPPTHWKQTFFPLEKVVVVNVEDEVHYEIKAIHQTNTVFWEWNTRIFRKKTQIAEFSQCNLNISREERVVGRTSFRPCLSLEGKIRRRVLELCDGTRSIKEISALIYDDFPEKYNHIKQVTQEVVGIVRNIVEI